MKAEREIKKEIEKAIESLNTAVEKRDTMGFCLESGYISGLKKALQIIDNM